jgi:hypothetical protein
MVHLHHITRAMVVDNSLICGYRVIAMLRKLVHRRRTIKKRVRHSLGNLTIVAPNFQASRSLNIHFCTLMLVRVSALQAANRVVATPGEGKSTKHRKRQTILYDILQDDEVKRAWTARCKCAADCIAQFSEADVFACRTLRSQMNANEEATHRYATLSNFVVAEGKKKVQLMNYLVCIQAYCVIIGANMSTGVFMYPTYAQQQVKL